MEGWGCCVGAENVLPGAEVKVEGVDVWVGLLGAGEMEEKPTRPLRLAPWAADIGLGAANCVLDVMDEVEVGSGRLASEEVMEGWVVEGAEMKSSKSSSSAAARPLLAVECAAGCLPFEVVGFGGVMGGTSSSPNSKRSTSGSFFFVSSVFRLVGVLDETFCFRRAAGETTAPSSSSSYSSKRSLLPPLPVVPES